MSEEQVPTKKENPFGVEVVRASAPFYVKLYRNGTHITTFCLDSNVTDYVLVQHVNRWGIDYGIKPEHQEELIQVIKNMRDNSHLMKSE